MSSGGICFFEGFGKSSGEFAIRYYAKNLQPRGINANTIIPGVVNTEAWNGYVIFTYFWQCLKKLISLS